MAALDLLADVAGESAGDGDVHGRHFRRFSAHMRRVGLLPRIGNIWLAYSVPAVRQSAGSVAGGCPSTDSSRTS